MSVDNKAESVSFHDNHVHGLSIVEGDGGTGELVLDIDYISEWLSDENGSFSFRISPAELRFHDVFNLKITIDFKSATAAIGPFSIHSISSTEEFSTHRESNREGKIELNWPVGEITFTSSGFVLLMKAPSTKSSHQFLSKEERTVMLEANSSFEGTSLSGPPLN